MLDITPELARKIRRHPAVRRILQRELASAKMRSVVDFLTPVQREFVVAPGKKRAALAGRRGGKSVALLAWLVLGGAAHPDGLSAYTCISVGRAREILNPATSILRKEAGIDLQWTSKRGLVYLLCPNGHRIWVSGCSNRGQVDTFRGSPLVRWVGDESARLDPYLEELTEEAIGPALLDHDGDIALAGTPGPVPAGYWHRVSTELWPRWHWTVLDNPTLPHAASWLESKKASMGWTDSSPTYAREYLARWTLDLESLCYPYSPEKNAYSDLPSEGTWRCILAIDLGVVDDAAMVVCRWRSGDEHIYLDDCFSQAGLSPTELGQKVLEWRQRYRPAFIVADTGGIGKAFTTEWSHRYNVQTLPASKSDTAGQIAIVGGELQSGKILAHTVRCRELIEQWMRLTWDEARKGHDPRFPDHLADAGRYGVLAIRSQNRPELEKPQPGTPEWAKEQDRKEFEARLGAARKRNQRRDAARRRQLVAAARRAA